jgi:hypothetical protein
MWYYIKIYNPKTRKIIIQIRGNCRIVHIFYIFYVLGNNYRTGGC